MMKYVFILVLLLLGGVGSLMGAALAVRFVDNMTETPRVMPGERVFVMPPGSVPRGGERMIPKAEREAAARLPNPIPMSAESVAIGQERFRVFCTPCHGPEAKGGVTGPVAVKFIPPPDLTSADFQKQRTDGYWHHVILTGGAVMPAYGEALSSEEAWHLVNFLRSVAAR